MTYLSISKTVFFIAIVSPILNGCSSQESRKQAELGFEYLEVKEVSKLNIPASLSTPVYTTQYDIPSPSKTIAKNYVGANVDVRSPALVLPITVGSHVEQNDTEVTLWIDIPEGRTNAEPFIWEIIDSYIASQSIPVLRIDKSAGELETDWYVQSNNDDEDAIFNLRQRYLYKVKFKPHGRTIGLSAQLLASETQVEGDAWYSNNDAADMQRYSVQALNKLILYFDARRDQFNQQVTEKSKKDESVNSENLSYIDELQAPRVVAKADFTDVPRIILLSKYTDMGQTLRNALETMGFVIKEVIVIDGFAKLSFSPRTAEELAEYDVSPLPLKAGNYQLQIGDLKTKTSLLFSNGEGQVLPEWQVKAILKHLVPLMADGVYPKSNKK